MKNLIARFHKDRLWVAPVVSIVAFIGGAIAGAILEEWMGKDVVRDHVKALFFVLLFLVAILMILGQAFVLLVKLYKKIGIEIRYVDDDPFGNVYAACREVVDKATHSIYVVNSYLMEGHDGAGNDPKKKARLEYYSSLIQKALSGISYIRIVQVKGDNSPLTSMQEDDLHFDHLRDMVLKRCRTVTLLKAPANRLTTFVLIDNEHLIWQINKVTFDGNGKEVLSLQGAFIIYDPHRQITGQFVEYFENLRGAETGPVCLVNGRLK